MKSHMEMNSNVEQSEVRRDRGDVKRPSNELPHMKSMEGRRPERTRESERPSTELPHLKETGAYQKNIDGVEHYYDDNGKLYRKDNNLVPNSKYELNGYRYTSDEKSRITSAQGTLHLKERETRLPIKDPIENIGKGDQKENDDRGHLIGDQFDGVNRLENMVPQNADVNRNSFRNFENELAKEVKSGKDVNVKVEPMYEGNSHRPESIVVIYKINGNEGIRIFPNDKEN